MSTLILVLLEYLKHYRHLRPRANRHYAQLVVHETTAGGRSPQHNCTTCQFCSKFLLITSNFLQRKLVGTRPHFRIEF